MTAVGLSLEHDRFTNAGSYGPHLLAPTASDLRKYGKKDTILAGFHSDLNFLLVHFSFSSNEPAVRTLVIGLFMGNHVTPASTSGREIRANALLSKCQPVATCLFR